MYRTLQDFAAAAKILEPLCLQNGNVTSPPLRSAVARIYLQGGYVAMAAKHFAAVAEDPTADPVQKIMNAALFASAEGDWERATAELQKILVADPENIAVRHCRILHIFASLTYASLLQAVNNLAVALLNQGRLREVSIYPFLICRIWSSWCLTQGIETLENALRASPATIVTAEPFLFNLCECRSENSAHWQCTNRLDLPHCTSCGRQQVPTRNATFSLKSQNGPETDCAQPV